MTEPKKYTKQWNCDTCHKINRTYGSRAEPGDDARCKGNGGRCQRLFKKMSKKGQAGIQSDSSIGRVAQNTSTAPHSAFSRQSTARTGTAIPHKPVTTSWYAINSRNPTHVESARHNVPATTGPSSGSTIRNGWDKFFGKGPKRTAYLQTLDEAEKEKSPSYEGKNVERGILDIRGI